MNLNFKKNVIERSERQRSKQRRERLVEGWWIVIGCDGVFGYCNFKSSCLL